MSHEIRTPLGAILGFSELLKNPNLSHEHRNQYIDTITKNGWSLTKIIDDILDLAKVEAGKLEIEHFDFHLLICFQEWLNSFRKKRHRKRFTLSLSLIKMYQYMFILIQ